VKKLFSLLLVVMLLSIFCVPRVAGEANKILINMQIGSKTAYVNGLPISLDVPPQIINGRTLVPIRFVSENLGADVGWDNDTRTVTITMDSIPYLNNKISSLEIEKSSLTTRNGALQEKVTTLETEKANLVTQNSVLQQRIDELEEETSVNTATQIAEQNSQNVVYIETDKGIYKGQGSGFLATTDGKVVTNYHVIKDASTATVKLGDGRSYTLSGVINYDADRDIAILQLPISNTQSVTLGDSNKIANGDDIVVIGNPKGLENSVTTGVISSTSRVIDNQVWVQFSAPVSPGSSGGPIFNSNGEVVGVVTSKIVQEEVEGINFAVPINDVKTLLSYNKPATFSELFETGGSTSTSWTLTDNEIQDAINFGKSTKDDRGKFYEPFNFGPQAVWQTRGKVSTPYFWVAYIASENALKGKDTTNADVQHILSLFGDKLGFSIAVYGDSIDFAKNYSAKLIVNGKTLYPIVTNNKDIATATSVYPSSPAYRATNAYYFDNSEVPRDATVTLVVNNGHGETESLVIDLAEIP